MSNPYLRKGIAAGVLIALSGTAHAGTISNGNNASVTIGGYVDRALWYADDGKDSTTAVVDNENLSSRFFIAGESKVNEALTAGFLMEFDFRDNSSSSVTIDDANAGNGGVGTGGVGATTFSQRHMDAYFSHVTLGKLSIGQGASASDGAAEVDMSGTGIVAYSGIADMAAGVKFRTAAGGYGPAIGTVSSNMDGLSLDDRIRYDTPSFAGFGLATSYISGGAGDVGVNFSGKFGGVDVGAAVAYFNNSATNTTDDGGYVGSVSAKHDSGISLTVASGKTLKKASGTDDPTFVYGKLAYTAGLTSLGDTSFGVDYGTEVYLGYRNHELDRTGTSYDDIMAVMAGVNVAF